MLNALGVLEFVVAQGRHRLAEGVEVVEQAGLTHTGILLQRVMGANPLHRPLHARVVLFDAGVEKALEAAVGHGAQRTQAAVRRLVYLVVGVRTVDEAALVVGRRLGRERLVVGFRAGQVLAATDEFQRPLDGRVVLGHAGLEERVDEELRVGQVGPALSVVADAAEMGVLGVGRAVLQPLEELGGVLDDRVVLAALVGLLEGHQGDAGGVVGQALTVDAAVLFDALFQVLQPLGDDRIVVAVAVAEQGGDDQGGDARPGGARRPAAVLALVLFEKGVALVEHGPHVLGVGADGVGRRRPKGDDAER